MRKTGAGESGCAGTSTALDRIWSNELTEDRAGRQRRANADADTGGGGCTQQPAVHADGRVQHVAVVIGAQAVKSGHHHDRTCTS